MGAMANRNLEKLASIDAQLRALVPVKVSEDDKLVEYDALLLDRFLDILQDLHGEDLRETVRISVDWFKFLVLIGLGCSGLILMNTLDAKHLKVQLELVALVVC